MKRKEIIIERKDILEPIFQKMLQTEMHHTHEIIQDKNGVLRWKKGVNTDSIDSIFYEAESRSSESLRRLYRDLGYSLFAYYELFYWLVNNEDADSYLPLQIP